MDIFAWSPLVMTLPFIVVGAVAFFLGTAFLAVFARQAAGNPLTMPVAAFVGTITTAWALSLGFTAADVWSVNSRASQVASEERSSMMRLAGMAKPEALASTELLAGLKAYKDAVVSAEWQNGNRAPELVVEQALQSIRLVLIGLAKAGHPDPVIAQMVQDFDELQDARNSRLAIGTSSVNQLKWYLVLFLTMLSAIVVGAVHADRPHAGRKAILIFAVTAGVSLWILALHANPYVGVAQVTLGDVRL
ncbi:hypothetical protein [Aminobacter carboxidus]|uniref:DUF4239 domain-containing protein n=2 Tax=Aminobacter carboxidus TaxID=376165 RepID=A0A8E1WIV9_9HYPH|nr:hypothetical protein [Aminobacter lissarensis]MBB6468719.1 hypothetical protein [Aminobacter lissarensis]